MGRSRTSASVIAIVAVAGVAFVGLSRWPESTSPSPVRTAAIPKPPDNPDLAWADFGSRAGWDDISSDPSFGIALVLVACERGYDCTSANLHNMLLNCRINPDCGSASTLEEMYDQQLPAEVNARARTHYLELKALLESGDWSAIEKFIPLDGPAFK